MYVTVREQVPKSAPAGLVGPETSRPWYRPALPVVARNVLLLGLTSLFTDISSEMVAAILPLYLVFFLGLSPLQFGIVDGLYQGFAALVRVASGYLADRWRRHKEIAVFGYGLSAVCKLAFLAAGSAWLALGGIVMADRTGKGIRTAPRDALISLSTPPQGMATAFGVHRALDTFGAMVGPVVAFLLLAQLPNAFDVIFVTSFCFALIGLGLLVLFVQSPTAVTTAIGSRAVSLRAALGLLRAPDFRSLAIAGAALAFFTISDGFLYLVLQRRLSLNAGLFPLLFVGTSVSYFLLAVPAGRLADRWGRGRVLLAGYLLLLPVYGLLLLPSLGYAHLAVALLLFGAYYAATDGVLMASASTVLAPELRTTGMGFITTGTTMARLISSVIFGALWTTQSMELAVILFIGGLVVALPLATWTLARTGQAGPALATTPGDASTSHDFIDFDD